MLLMIKFEIKTKIQMSTLLENVKQEVYSLINKCVKIEG